MITEEKREDLKKHIQEIGLTQNNLADLFEVSQANINALLNGKTAFGKKVASKWEEKLGVRAGWLLTGEGSMLKGDKLQGVNAIENPPVSEGLPLIPFEFMAGYGEDDAGIKLGECERYNIPEFENIGAEFLVRVGGSSMYPKYSSGDILACKKVHDILFFQWGKVYVIDCSQGQLVKRICEHENPGMLLLVSDNKEKYPPFPMPKSDIRSLSIVVGVVRME
jgi:phage repressor protein C with HTH and peptisase S24 domain